MTPPLTSTTTLAKTEKNWAGSSRLFVMKLADGTFHYAIFTFTR